jgi:hypothetical protein
MVWLLGSLLLPPPPAAAEDPASSIVLISEVRRAFTLGGERIPPEIFRDFGDGNLADSAPIWVTVDLRAAVGSNLYADEIRQSGDWIIQRKAAPATMNGMEETAYKYIGATENALLVVLATYNGGGSGDFVTLHILDVSAAPAFDFNGEPYDRINLTTLRSIALGDRWEGEVEIVKNAVRVVTTRKGPADRTGTREEKTIEARRP